MSKTPITERREWSFLPYRKHRDAATGLVHDLPPVVVEDRIGVIASCGSGGPDHDNEAFARLMSSAPDLLRVALALVAALEGKRAANEQGESGFEFNDQLWRVVLPAAQFAIAKATA